MTITATLVAEFSRHNARIRAARVDYYAHLARIDRNERDRAERARKKASA